MSNGNYANRQLAEGTPITDSRTWGVLRGERGEQVVFTETADGPGSSEITAEVTSPANPEVRVDLDDMADDLQNLRIVQKMLSDWKAEEERIKDKIKARLGRDGTGYIAGRPVWVHSPTEKFSTKQFQKAHPDLYDQFTRPKLIQELDTEELRRALPLVFEEFRVSSLRPLGPRS